MIMIFFKGIIFIFFSLCLFYLLISFISFHIFNYFVILLTFCRSKLRSYFERKFISFNLSDIGYIFNRDVVEGIIILYVCINIPGLKGIGNPYSINLRKEVAILSSTNCSC